MWLGGKIGGAIGSFIDACHNNGSAPNAGPGKRGRDNCSSMYFDQALEEIQRKKRRDQQ